MNRLVVSVIVIGSALAGVQVRTARACSPPLCNPSQFTPGNDQTVPANLPAIHWRPRFSFGPTDPDPQPTDLTLTTSTDMNTSLAFTATKQADDTYLIVPTQALVAGTTYVITETGQCGGQPLTDGTSTFHVVAAAPLPTQLGTLTADVLDPATLVVPTSSGSCTTTIWADQSTIDLAVAPEAMPWVHALIVDSVVDGQPYGERRRFTFGAFTGQDVERIYHTCATDDPGASPGLSAGNHSIIIRASLPGTTTVLDSAATTTTLECDATPPPDVCADNPALCEDENTVDGPDPEDGGCCSTSDRTPAASWALLALVVLAGISRRKTPDRCRRCAAASQRR